MYSCLIILSSHGMQKSFPFSSRRTMNFSKVSLDDILLPIHYVRLGLRGTSYVQDVLCLIEEYKDPNSIVDFRQVSCCIPPWTTVFIVTCRTGTFLWPTSYPNNKNEKLNVFVLLEYVDKRRTKTFVVSWAGISFSYDLGYTQCMPSICIFWGNTLTLETGLYELTPWSRSWNKSCRVIPLTATADLSHI